MRIHLSRSWRALWFLLPLLLLGQPLQPKEPEFDLTQRYLVLGTYRTSTLRKEISQAATAGCRVVAGWEERELVVLLEKVADPPGTYQYQLVTTPETSTMEKELQEAGAAGFRVVPQAIFLNTSHEGVGGSPEVVVVMEKAPNSTEAYEYRVVFHYHRESLLRAVLEGYAVSGMVTVSRPQWGEESVQDSECEKQGGTPSECSHTEERLVSVPKILVMEKLKGAPPLPPSAEARPDVLQRYLMVHFSPAALRKQLVEATMDGYCLRAASWPAPLAMEAILEKAPQLTNDDVIGMVRAGSTQETILEAIRTNQSRFDTSAEALLALKNAGVSEEIIRAMLAAGRAPEGPSAPSSGSDALPARVRASLMKDGTSIPSPGACQYLVVAGAEATSLQDRLRAVAARGFRPHPAGIFYPTAVVMEKAAEGADGFSYLFLEGLSSSKLQQRLAEVSPLGYRVVGANASVVVLGKPAKTRQEPAMAGTEPAKAGAREIADPRQALLAAKTVAVLGAWGEREMPGTFGKIVTLLGAASEHAVEGRSTGGARSYEADPPTAKQKVEDAIRKWGRFTVLDDPSEADLVLLVVVRSYMKFGLVLRSNELLVFPGGAVPGQNSVALWQSGDTKALSGYAATKVTGKFQEYVQDLEKKAQR
jgi:hypothetical protein